MKNIKHNLIVTLANRRYLNHAKQVFSSLYFNAGWDGDYMLLAHQIPKQELEWFSKRGILVKECDNIFVDDELKKLYDEKKVFAQKNKVKLIKNLAIHFQRAVLMTKTFFKIAAEKTGNLVGKAGILLKNISPKTYYLIKK